MSRYQPGDHILFRDGDRFGVARVDLVKDRHLTGFPFDPAHRRWSRRNRRIACDFVIARLPVTTDMADLAARIEALRNQREALRQKANRWLEDNVRQLIEEAR